LETENNIKKDHNCLLGIWIDFDNSFLITQKGIVDCVGTDARYGYTRYKLPDYFDKRKSVNLRRFEYCPDCGKRIDWEGIKREYKEE